MEMQDIQFKQQKNLCVVGGQALEQVDHRGCGVSVGFGDIKNLTGNGPEQPGLNEPALSRVLGWMVSRVPFQPQLLCHSLNPRST